MLSLAPSWSRPATRAGDWHCVVCYFPNAALRKACKVCDNPKPIVAARKEDDSETEDASHLPVLHNAASDAPEPALCCVCLLRAVRIVFLPCHHAISCERCVSAISDWCRLCYADVKDTMPRWT